jgi:hypothetical protein
MSRGYGDLFFTSVDDCRSTLKFYERADLPGIRRALKESVKAGEKTRAKLLEAKIRQLKKADPKK